MMPPTETVLHRGEMLGSVFENLQYGDLTADPFELAVRGMFYPAHIRTGPVITVEPEAASEQDGTPIDDLATELPEVPTSESDELSVELPQESVSSQHSEDEQAKRAREWEWVRTIGEGGRDAEQAFEELWHQHHLAIYRYIYYRVGSEQTAEDIAAETFTRFYRKVSNLAQREGAAVGALLVTVARNLVADHFKNSHSRLSVPIGEMNDTTDVLLAPPVSPEDVVLAKLDGARLDEVVSLLMPAQQECIRLRFMVGLTVAETAEAMGKNEGAIKTLQYRATKSLGRLLARKGYSF